jgi:hypothetical protein
MFKLLEEESLIKKRSNKNGMPPRQYLIEKKLPLQNPKSWKLNVSNVLLGNLVEMAWNQLNLFKMKQRTSQNGNLKVIMMLIFPKYLIWSKFSKLV